MTPSAKTVPALVALAMYAASVVSAHAQEQPRSAGANAPNHAPTVKIITPKTGTAVEKNAQVRYEIEVSDQEDGDSKFQEINPAEVLLTVRYLSGAAGADAALSQPIAEVPPGLLILRSSDCLNCHSFDARLIGPSLVDIRKRYAYSPANVEGLSRHILMGISGVWGSIKMPSHPQLTMQQATACVTWILEMSADPETHYYTGTEGAFRAIVPADSKGSGMLVLVASYMDHGVKDDPSQRLQGQDSVRIRIDPTSE